MIERFTIFSLQILIITWLAEFTVFVDVPSESLEWFIADCTGVLFVASYDGFGE